MLPLRAIFSGKRVALRAPRVSDAPRIVEIRTRSREFLRAWVPVPGPDEFDVDLARTRLLRDRRDIRADRHYRFCMTLGEDGPVIGRVALTQVFRGIFQSASLGYWVDVEHHGQGFTTEGVRLALDVAFREIGLHRIQAAIMPHNAASLAVARKCGLRHEGRAARYLQIDGAWQDHLLFAVTAEDWPAAPR
ncbi:GNAT family N-acetyltransferase [Polyangium mundeleinium]|uniref:GNAT family protein n=1 Tax=Polyangium mundeleinium TaxID=2995306 RepID=A0ABT5EQA9_9BACT|nr:GNAT family protein [Polyangium mundeleinium]MDC0743519.1 GNAT family protein [Polyangium mundeleinium]